MLLDDDFSDSQATHFFYENHKFCAETSQKVKFSIKNFFSKCKQISYRSTMKKVVAFKEFLVTKNN